ncbi:MAG: GDSL-type esterase/lipase family protein [Pseudomonadota bacterium]|nr:GDSL-type esterase/lipase family protein [Pseudomonadota bacterium]
MKRTIKIVGTNIVLVIGVIVVAELLFGNWIFGPQYSFLNLPRNEKRYFDVSKFMSGQDLIQYTRDKHGLRGNYGGDPKNIDILVLGGSTTNERFLDDKSTWVAQLGQRFFESNHMFTIVNAGVEGQSTRGHIASFDLWFPNIPGLRPRYVIGYIGINDIAVGKDREQYDYMQSPDPVRRFRQYLVNHSVFYNHIRRFRGILLARKTRLNHGANSYKLGKWVPVVKQIDLTQLKSDIKMQLNSYEERLRHLAQKIVKFGAEPIFVTQTRGDYRLKGKELYVLVDRGSTSTRFGPTDRGMRQMALFNNITLSVCKDLDIFCIDLANDLKFKETDFYDSVHTTPAGSKKIADYLFRELNGVLR